MDKKLLSILTFTIVMFMTISVTATTEACVNETGLDLLICEIINNIWTIAVLLIAIAVLLVIVKAFSARNMT